MATRAAHKRLTREYATLSRDPPEYITAHPAEQNILEWHYVLTGPPNTPYHNGQYWGTLVFPPDYPFAPPAIRMHTPSGRFKCSERLCLSISDFHPKSYNPAWEVSTILLGVLSFMTSEEKTTGSIQATSAEREWFAKRTRWWNSTGGGSKHHAEAGAGKSGNSAIKAGDGGKKFREQWPELDEENWKWLAEQRVDLQTGNSAKSEGARAVVEGEVAGQGKGVADGNGAGNRVVGAPQVQRSWFARNKYYLVFGVLFVYVLIARAIRDQES